MRRGFSIFLILLFGLGPLSVTLGWSEDANLPACCRRHGSHHCAMTAEMAAMMARAESSAAPQFAAPPRCPFYPGFTTGPLTLTHALAASQASLPALLEQKRQLAAVAARVPIEPLRSHAGRGPPDLA